ncbi:metal-dependent hydrolase [Promethearchaeum syntrophicum]|uniref:Metal-dependent hydrolase n=1 Tax=Promethearchaeum syntrophicum TaxID=2594042 RepID=A0A5B9D8L4_9ARCH|nr:metal-dependent hydrolase [Candidatus Prometheoarchaeum syntrophicum]QEE15479.1 hypothetical protein DSAG12_01305 [Candidatus Prometheoarchaeum syntrophicum]
MFPLFHIFLPLLVFELILSNKNFKMEKTSRFWIILGSLLPDLIDKPISLITKMMSGRGIAHTPIFLFSLSILIYFLTQNKWISLSIGFGMVFHLILDIPDLPWFWPFNPLEPYSPPFDSWIDTLLHNPLIISTEIISLVGLSWILISNKILFNGKLINLANANTFLFETPKSLKILRAKINLEEELLNDKLRS